MCKVCGGMAENLEFHGCLQGLLLRVGGRCRFKVELAPIESHFNSARNRRPSP